MNLLRKLAVVITAMVISLAAQGDPVSYDESLDGDISSDVAAPTFDFQIGLNQFIGSLFFSVEGATDFDAFVFSLPEGTRLSGVTYTYSNVDLVPGTSELGAIFLIRTLDSLNTCGLEQVNVAAANTGTFVLDDCVIGNISDFEFLEGDWSWQHTLFRTGPGGGGGSWDYTLSFHVTSVSESVTIDIKPGSYPNSINLKSKGTIPVAILTTDTFIATQVDWDTVLFSGAPKSHAMGHVKDVDDDGDMDLLLHFYTQDTGIACGDTEATLTGATYSGDAITGTDLINTVKCP